MHERDVVFYIAFVSFMGGLVLFHERDAFAVGVGSFTLLIGIYESIFTR